MSSKSNDQGRAFEYACIMNLREQISKIRSCTLVENSSFFAARRAWQNLSKENQTIYKVSSLAAVNQIFNLEPRIVEDSDDNLELSIQPDTRGKTGDVRDILIIRKTIAWEIGLSLKHNHFAIKHSRLSSKLDFGNSWYDIPCSSDYWETVTPIFNYLSNEKNLRKKFSELPDKEHDVYKPLLTAFIEEIKFQSSKHKDVPAKMVEYLLGIFDFYKVVSVDKEHLTRIQGFNMHGSLNLPSSTKKAKIEVPIVSLPTRIAFIEFAPNKNNTINMFMDGGWQFSFRIHNAATYVEPSLKFDIQIIGMPAAILTINCLWK